MIRAMTRGLSMVGVNATIFDQSRNRQLVGLDDIGFARDYETAAPDAAVRFVFIRDVDPEAYLDPTQTNVAIVDLAPDAEDTETLAVLQRFDAVFGVSQWVTQALNETGIAAHWIGRSFEIAEKACLPRRHFDLPDSAFVVVIPFDSDEITGSAIDDIYATFTRDLLAADPTGRVRVAVMASSSLLDMPEFPDDPRISWHTGGEDDLLTDSLLNAADCVVSFESLLRVARSLGRAAWMGCPVLSLRQSADVDLPIGPFDPATLAQCTEPQATADLFVRETLRIAAGDAGPAGATPAGAAGTLTEFSYRAVGLRLLHKINDISA